MSNSREVSYSTFGWFGIEADRTQASDQKLIKHWLEGPHHRTCSAMAQIAPFHCNLIGTRCLKLLQVLMRSIKLINDHTHCPHLSRTQSQPYRAAP